MRNRDSSDVMLSAIAVASDAAAVFGGLVLATWIRFGAGWIPLVRERPPNLWQIYTWGAGVATLIFLFIYYK